MSDHKIKIFSCDSNRPFAEKVCKYLNLPLGDASVKHFADGEVSVQMNESVRNCDIYIIQSTCRPVNDSLMELLIMTDACRRSSAHSIAAVIPYFGYARQDRISKPREPISAKLVANLITTAGVDRVITMDLHAAQIQGFFDIPADNLRGGALFVDYFSKLIKGHEDEFMVVSPDVGSVSRARSFATELGLPMAIVDKRREKANVSEVMNIIGNVSDKKVIILDDMVDTAGSLCGAAKALVEIGKAKEIYACASHGVLSGPAIDRLNDSYINKLLLLDTMPFPAGKECSKIEYITASELFAKCIDKIHKGEPISSIYG